MSAQNIYELFLIIAQMDIDFNDVFKNLNEPTKSELLNFIKFLKTNPSPKEYADNKISLDVFNAYFFFVKSVVEKM